MRTVPTLASWGCLVLFGGFFGIVFWKLLTGGINLNQLLDGDIRNANSADGSGYDTQASAGRAQLLMITLFTALYCLLQVIDNPKEFPKVPTELLAALGGSQALYLGGKAQAMWLGRLRNLFK
jgi:hypothetical protein